MAQIRHQFVTDDAVLSVQPEYGGGASIWIEENDQPDSIVVNLDKDNVAKLIEILTAHKAQGK